MALQLLRYVDDAMARTAKVDAAIIITRLQTPRRGIATATHRLLGTVPARKLGLALTRAEAEDRYGYG